MTAKLISHQQVNENEINEFLLTIHRKIVSRPLTSQREWSKRANMTSSTHHYRTRHKYCIVRYMNPINSWHTKPIPPLYYVEPIHFPSPHLTPLPSHFSPLSHILYLTIVERRGERRGRHEERRRGDKGREWERKGRNRDEEDIHLSFFFPLFSFIYFFLLFLIFLLSLLFVCLYHRQDA